MISKHKTDQRPGVAAKIRAQTKVAHYKPLAAEHNLHFVALVLESFGRWGDDLISFVSKTVTASWHHNGELIPLGILKGYWKKRIAVTLQKVNAQTLLSHNKRVAAGSVGRRDESYYHDNIFDSKVRVVQFQRGG